MAIEKRVVRKGWGFEVWTKSTDEKGKTLWEGQTGIAVHGPEPEDFQRALALMDPFRQ